jgi:hypothetical protein
MKISPLQKDDKIEVWDTVKDKFFPLIKIQKKVKKDLVI